MTDIENEKYQVSLIALDGVDSRPVKSGHRIKISLGVALLCGLGLAFSIMAQSASGPRDSMTQATAATNLVGLSRKLQTSSAAESLCTTTGSLCIPITSPYQKLAVARWKAINEGKSMRDVAMMAHMDQQTKATMDQMKNDALVRAAEGKPTGVEGNFFFQERGAAATVAAEDMPGVTVPVGFWDPLGLSADIPQGKLLWFREAEIKHGRVAMLASLGLLVAEKYHPFFGISEPDFPMAMVNFQNQALTFFWLNLFILGFCMECDALKAWEGFGNASFKDETFVPGNLGFDPLGIKPQDPVEWKRMQTKEINNGRLAMLGMAGMLAEEYLTGKQIDPAHPPWFGR